MFCGYFLWVEENVAALARTFKRVTQEKKIYWLIVGGKYDQDIVHGFLFKFTIFFFLASSMCPYWIYTEKVEIQRWNIDSIYSKDFAI